MSEMTNAEREQESGIEQINRVMIEMDNVTQQNAALVEEAAAAANALREQTNSLNQIVGVFKFNQKYLIGQGQESDIIENGEPTLTLGNSRDNPSQTKALR